MCSVSNLFAAAAAEEHVILILAILWFGALSLGFLIQQVVVMVCGGRSRSSSIWRRWLVSVGSKSPLQGMKQAITL